MPTKRTSLKRKTAMRINQAAVDAWQRGEWHDLHLALGLPPWHYSPLPLPFGYGLPDKKPEGADYCIYATWDAAKALQRELFALAGEPGSLSASALVSGWLNKGSNTH